jgi:MoaE-MoaD fusion protein
MRVRVLFFGQLKEIVGRSEEEAEVAEGSRVEDLLAGYRQRFPQLAEMRASLAASVNQEFAPWARGLHAGDEVAFLPPVSGGEAGRLSLTADLLSEKLQEEGEIYAFVREPIRSREIIAAVKAPEDGAVVAFDGVVRNHSGERETLYLEYEAYEPMALKKMREIGAALRRNHAIHRVAMVHRLGRLEIGETSVLIAISSAHRAAAFAACRDAIDTLKRAVPIWKKEYFSGGAVWVEGENPAEQSFDGPGESSSR